MLNPSDVYVEGGTNDLLVCWTDNVTKYDASSFYNFEQDNLPLHDLDERTQLLWEKLGHPTSALTGMSFIVSADATSSCNPLYFTTLSGCINALPEVINYPILVEVASFGDLGGLHISNKAFGPDGSLEIINRNSAFAGALDTSGNGMTAQEYLTNYSDYKIASSVTPIVSAMEALQGGASAPSLSYDMQSAQMFVNGQYISSAVNRWTDARYGTTNPGGNTVKSYVFSRKVLGKQNNRLTAAIGSDIAPWNLAAASYAAASSFAFSAFDVIPANRTGVDNMNSFDVSTLNQLNKTEINWGDGTQANNNSNTAAAAFAYLNKLDFIKVTECNGPIFIRNFNVDGENTTERGIEIKNSTVNLERCSASRCKQAGLYADNSEVNLLRGFVGYRNYGFKDGSRVGVPFADKRDFYLKQSSYGAGIYAVNSTINIKSTYDRDIEKSRQSVSAVYDGYALSGLPAPSMEALYCVSRNDIGVHCVNSDIVGGRTELDGLSTGATAGQWQDATQLIAELNTESGIKLTNSNLRLSGRINLDGNYFGLDSENSNIEVDSLRGTVNQSTALNLKNSHLIYNKDLYKGSLVLPTAPEDYQMSQLAFTSNGSDIRCDSATIKPLFTSSVPTTYGLIYTSGAFGCTNPRLMKDSAVKASTLLPSIEATNNSKLDLVHAHIDRTNIGTDADLVDVQTTYGAMIKATRNSSITCRGSSKGANVFIGPTTREYQLKLAGLYAGKQSAIYLQGPTAAMRLGVDALAEDYSLIDFGPHRDQNGDLMVSSFNLSTDGSNHTMVELHSTRASLVANRKSSINIKDLGYWKDKWQGSPHCSAQNFDHYNYNLTDAQAICVSNGWMQLYPNANFDDGADGVWENPAGIPTVGSENRYKFSTDTPSATNYKYAQSILGTVSAITTGGMSVRAVDDSRVNLLNVHFPCGWANTSGYAYDYQGSDPLPGAKCSRLHIWNIADTSNLKASYLSISGVHPFDSGYFGPSGTWGDVSGAPSSTPDTSSLSLLDYYGRDESNQHLLGKSEFENFGPFRLFFSVNPVARSMRNNVGTDLSGIIHQIFSQGYNFSGATIPDHVSTEGFPHPSSIHTSILNLSATTAGDATPDKVVASGFYYASAMMTNPDTILASLDESAANAFANAKHNSVGKSGLGRVVEIFLPTDRLGGESPRTDLPYGLGLLSVNNFDLTKDN
tara:strand:+ start:13616 stop:17176 length:3561 start_codon:yes stop_codon:yes gene_type:complete